jgi:hypothetical protein
MGVGRQVLTLTGENSLALPVIGIVISVAEFCDGVEFVEGMPPNGGRGLGAEARIEVGFP